MPMETSLPGGEFTCPITFERVRPPRPVVKEEGGITYVVQGDYELAFRTVLRFASGRELRVRGIPPPSGIRSPRFVPQHSRFRPAPAGMRPHSPCHSGDLHRPWLRRGRRPDQLWNKSFRYRSAGRHLGRKNSQGGEAVRSAGRATEGSTREMQEAARAKKVHT